MSVLVPLKDLTSGDIRLIQKSLTIKPKDPPSWTGTPSQPKQPVMMYQVTEDKKYVRLPYRFACILKGRILNHDRPHHRVRDLPFELTLRDYQIDPIEEAYQQLMEHGTTMIGLPPGWGKTILGVYLWHKTKLAVTVFCHRDTIAEQWVTSFKKCVPGATIWVVGNQPIPSEMPEVIICLDGRIDKIPEEFKRQVGTVIYDEVHLLCTPQRAPRRGSVGCLLGLEPRYVIGESATLKRDDGMHLMAQSILGVHGVFKTSKQSYLVVAVETDVKAEETITPRGTNFSLLCRALSESEERNKIVVELVKNNLHRKYIILSQRVDHVQVMQKLFIEAGISSDTLYRNKSQYNDSTVLLGTIPKMGTGFDEENACSDFKGVKSDVLILMHSVKKWQVFEQLRGRVMRSENPVVVWLNDKNRIPRRHLAELRSWIETTNGRLLEVHHSGITLP